MSFRTLVFLAADRITTAETLGGRREVFPMQLVPRCFVQVRADLLWDGGVEMYRNFGLEVVRLASHCRERTTGRLKRYAASFSSCEFPLFITVGGHHSLMPMLRWLIVSHDVLFPEAARAPDRISGRPRGYVSTHLDLAEYFGTGHRASGSLLTHLASACGVPLDVIRGLGQPNPCGALLRAVATCLIYLRVSHVAGRTTREARVRAEDELLERVALQMRNHGAAVTLCEGLRAERSFTDYDA